ncbi:MAG TPA: HD domain-containing phosphohydrolase [Solirubrobacterales bacterium]|nr:HD domain-containing phosphohydrolase [Solirubrobacterales bacterium]
MAREGSATLDRLRAAEVVGTLCLASDLGMGFPFEHGLQTTVIASRLAQHLDVDRETERRVYYGSLLAHAGCTTDAHVSADIFGSSLVENLHPVIFGSRRETFGGILRALPDADRPAPVRAIQAVRRLPRAAREQRPHFAAMCEVIQGLGQGFGLPRDVIDPLAHLVERWDGKGVLGRSKEAEIPLPIRIGQVAFDAALQRMLSGPDEAARTVGARAGGAFDPEIARCFADHGDEILAQDGGSSWDEVLEREPGSPLVLEGDAIDRALVAMAAFTDLVSPYFTGHSTGAAELAAAAAEGCRIDSDGVLDVRRAGLLLDLGRVAVHPKLWAKADPLTADEWEQVRLHPYQTERLLSLSPFFAELAPTAAAHHERIDGSGYHRGASGAEIPIAARVLAAADAYHAMREPRAHREALSPEVAASELVREASAGKLDPDAVTAVIEASGQRAPRLERPAGLTEREAEVVALLARGLMTKQVARELGIAAKTADTHVQNAYRKIGVSTRAGATLFAIQQGLIAWADVPRTQASA